MLLGLASRRQQTIQHHTSNWLMLAGRTPRWRVPPLLLAAQSQTRQQRAEFAGEALTSALACFVSRYFQLARARYTQNEAHGHLRVNDSYCFRISEDNSRQVSRL